MSKVYDIIIIGGGPAGYTAALYGSRSGFTTAVLEKLSAGGQMATTSEVDNYPGFVETIDGFELGERMQQGAERFGAETLYAEVESVDLKSNPKVLQTSEGEILAKTVIICTGAQARHLGLPKEESFIGRGIAYCATCDGMQYKNKVVVVNGGGNSAVEDALYLSKICAKVYLVHRRDSLRATPIYHAKLEQSGVEMVWNSKIKEILGEKRVEGVAVENVLDGSVKEIPCDALFVAIGRSPESNLFTGQLELDRSGYIVAGEDTKTSQPGVFVAGDVRTKDFRQIITAAADGALAAHSAEEFLLD